jgi:biotin transport system substrate-specific component
VLADLLPGTVVRDGLLVVGAACVVGALAQVSVHLPFTPVPVTGQTLGVLVAGTSLGWRRGAAGMALYAVAGVLGVPWFADHSSGYVGPTFGYVVGFVLCAAACGHLAERGADRNVLWSAASMVVGEVLLYGVGVTWLALSLHARPSEAISLGLTPFLAGDAIKAALAALALPGAWKLVGSRPSRPGGPASPSRGRRQGGR